MSASLPGLPSISMVAEVAISRFFEASSEATKIVIVRWLASIALTSPLYPAASSVEFADKTQIRATQILRKSQAMAYLSTME
jgi:hypothetical protein